MLAKGQSVCPTGLEVSGKEKCKEACKSLGIDLGPEKSFKNGKPCMRGGNRLCKQSKIVGSKASLLCKKSGTSISLAHQYN